MTEHVWKWELCVMCGATIICPKCGMNCCSGGYGEVDGEECDVCPLMYDEFQKAAKEGRIPRLPGDTLDERLAVLSEKRRKMEADGVRFVTDEEWENL